MRGTLFFAVVIVGLNCGPSQAQPSASDFRQLVDWVQAEGESRTITKYFASYFDLADRDMPERLKEYTTRQGDEEKTYEFHVVTNEARQGVLLVRRFTRRTSERIDAWRCDVDGNVIYVSVSDGTTRKVKPDQSDRVSFDETVSFLLEKMVRTPLDKEQCYNGAGYTNIIEHCGALIDSRAVRGRDLAVAFNNRGKSQLALKHYGFAIGDFNQAIRIDPDFADAYLNRGKANSSAGQVNAAVQDFDQVLRFDPSNAEACLGRGFAYRLMGLLEADHRHYNEALEDYDQSIRLDSSRWPPFMMRAELLREMGQPERAIEDYATVVRLISDKASSERLWYALCDAKEAMDQLQEALSDCNEAVRSGSQYSRFSRGIIYFKLNQLDAAIGDFDSILATKSNYAEVLFARGIAKRRNGNGAGGDADIADAIRYQADIAKKMANRGLRP